MPDLSQQPWRRRVLVLFGVAVAVSVVHYLDNTINYADYPQAPTDSTLPNPPAWLVGGAWFFFTAFGVWGIWAFMARRARAAAIGLAVYSGSGLVGFAHYAVPGALDMPWWRQAHVVADIACGVALIVVALVLAAGSGQASRIAASSGER